MSVCVRVRVQLSCSPRSLSSFRLDGFFLCVCSVPRVVYWGHSPYSTSFAALAHAALAHVGCVPTLVLLHFCPDNDIVPDETRKHGMGISASAVGVHRHCPYLTKPYRRGGVNM